MKESGCCGREARKKFKSIKAFFWYGLLVIGSISVFSGNGFWTKYGCNGIVRAFLSLDFFF